MKRKVNKVGQTTLTVSLPSKWAREHNLKAGDEIDVDEANGSLIVGINSKPIHRKLNLNVTNLGERQIKWMLAISYKEGYDEITTSYKDPTTINIIEKQLYQCPGYEIVEQTEKGCTIKNIARNLEDEFERAMRRNFLNTKSMLELCVQKVKDGDFSGLKELIRFEETNNKLSAFCERIVNVNKTFGEKSVFSYIIVWQMEKVVDELKYICEYFSENSSAKISSQTLALLVALSKLFDEYYALYYSFNIEKQIHLTDLYNDIKKKGYALMTKSKGDEVIMLSLILKASEKIVECIPSTFALHTAEYEK